VVKSKGIRINARVLASKKTIIQPKAKAFVSIRVKGDIASVDRDLLFEPKCNIIFRTEADFSASLVDKHVKVLGVYNAATEPITI